MAKATKGSSTSKTRKAAAPEPRFVARDVEVGSPAPARARRAKASGRTGLAAEAADKPYPQKILDSFGVSGVRRAGGYLLEEFHPNLSGRKKDKVFREMEDNSPLVGGALWAMEALVRQVEWRFDPPKDSGSAGQELADWFEDAREDLENPWESVISSIMSMATHGWAFLEELYKIRRGPDAEVPELRSQFDDGLWGWRDFAIRSQESRLKWEFDDEGRVLGMWQQVETDPRLRFIPIEKALLFRFRERNGSPEGRSLLRNVYRPYYFLTNEEEMEAVGIERNLNGYPVFEVPLSVLHKHGTEADRGFKTLAEEAVKNVRFDTATGLVIPAETDRQGVTGFKFGFRSPNGDPAAANTAIMRHRTDLMIGLLMQFLLLGSTQTGSWSLASEMTDLLAMAMNALLRGIATTFTSVAVPRLARLNGFDRRILPFLAFTDIEKPDVLKLWQTIQAAVSSGVLVPSDNFERWALEQSGWPVPDRGGRPRPSPTTPATAAAAGTGPGANGPAGALALRRKRSSSSNANLFKRRSSLALPGLE